MIYGNALKWGTDYLREWEVPEAEVNAWYLLEYCARIDRTQYFVRQMEEMPEDIWQTYQEVLEKRGRRIPLQYITGTQEFMGLEFQVNEHVLIPRQDTEVLVEEALKYIQDGQRVLDMCTGSGCIIVSLAVFRKIHAEAADISGQALKVAEKNAEKHGRDVRFVESDLFEKIEGQYDCIVSNPPYISSEEVKKLMPEVRDHEPVSALDGTKDGLYFYRKIVKEAEGHLVSKGWLLFEIGWDQGAAVSEMMRMSGYDKVEVKKDLAGLDRVVLGQRM